MCIAAMYSPADGILYARFASANTIGDVGIVASTGATGVASDMVSFSCVGSWISLLSESCSSWWIPSSAVAATRVMTASWNAGRPVTSDNSSQSAAWTSMVPSCIILNFVGFTPTETESITPSSISSSAASACGTLLSLAVNIIPCGVSTRSETMPTACSESWFM